MFWGLIMEPNKRYSQTVEKSFHVSMASLDVGTADDKAVQVMLCYEDRNYLLCSLNKSSVWQVPLDLVFQEGTQIAFTCNGHGNVHLTGYLTPDEDLDLDDIEEEEEDEEEQVVVPEKQPKRKALENLKNEKKVKRAKQEIEAESSDLDEDDDDIDLDGINEEDDSADSEEDESMLNQDEDDEDDSDEEEEEEDEEEEEEEEVVPQISKKSQQKDKKNKQQQQQQQKKNEDNRKMANGKEAKQEQNKEQKKKKGEQQQQANAQHEQKKRVVEGGVQVEDLKVGSGTPAKPGKFVSVYYVGRLKNGKKFDSTTQGDGFKFRLGKGEVIKGWDVGISGMKVGGKRRLTIPAAMAYGAKGSPPVIPGNSTLIFEVELRNVH